MADGSLDAEEHLAAGDFSLWIEQIQAAIRGERGSDVPCGECTACCTSAQFVYIGPDESETLARIPPELLFPAPRKPPGHVVLGFDARGHCPMLVDNRCSIYEHRPRACRTYDCRVFAATGLAPEGDSHGNQALIGRQARRWRFSFAAQADRAPHEAVRAAATFLAERRGLFPESAVPTNPTQLAVLALAIHEVFLGRDETTGEKVVVDPDPEAVRAAVAHRSGAGQAP